MNEVAQTALETSQEYGPFFALGVGIISATIVFLAIMLRNFLNKDQKGKCSNFDIMSIINALRQDQGKIFDKLDRMSHDISEMKAEIAFLYGKQNGKKL